MTGHTYPEDEVNRMLGEQAEKHRKEMETQALIDSLMKRTYRFPFLNDHANSPAVINNAEYSLLRKVAFENNVEFSRKIFDRFGFHKLLQEFLCSRALEKGMILNVSDLVAERRHIGRFVNDHAVSFQILKKIGHVLAIPVSLI